MQIMSNRFLSQQDFNFLTQALCRQLPSSRVVASCNQTMAGQILFIQVVLLSAVLLDQLYGGKWCADGAVHAAACIDMIKRVQYILRVCPAPM